VHFQGGEETRREEDESEKVKKNLQSTRSEEI
jgi:hypothetical protein